MPAFDTDNYAQQYGPALSTLAAADMAEQGSADPSEDPNYPQEGNIAAANAQSQNTAQLPSPIQQERQMDRQQPPPGANLGGGKGGGGPESNASSGAFYDPSQDLNGPHQSPPIYHAVSQLSDKQLKALESEHDDAREGSKDSHGVPDMDTIYQKTFADKLAERTKAAGLDGDIANKALNPSWRDKATMFLDAANRASALHAQNPQMSRGDTWAVATRGALDGWMAHAQGQHDNYMAQQQAFRDQASKDAQDAVKRAGDQFGFQEKADTLLEKKRVDAETERHNRATEANTNIKDTATAAHERSEGAKGDLVTGDDGYLYKVSPDGSAKQVKDGSGNPVQGTKTGTDKKPTEDNAALKTANAAHDKVVQSIEKEEAAKAKNPMNIGKDGATAEEKEARAKEILRTTDPKSYKVLYGDDATSPDPSAPPPAPAAAKGAKATAKPAWAN